MDSLIAQVLTFEVAILWAIVVLAAWLQAHTGFAFGLILMGSVGMLDLIPLPQASIIAGMLTIVNGSYMLKSEWPHRDRRALQLFLLAGAPGMVLGYVLLLYLAGTAISVLQLLLGVVILGASLQMMRKPKPVSTRSSDQAFAITGFIGGIMGGLFSTAGPSIIWQMYRQPVALRQVRATLLSVFVLYGLLRLGLVFGTTGITAKVWAIILGAIPLVIFGTFIARRFPPPLSPDAMRRFAFGLLFLAGVAMTIPAILALLKQLV